MSEIEIHAEHVNDAYGRRVGILVGAVGIILAIVTILSHRAHTAAVMHRTEANDQWSFYQAKKIRKDTHEVAATLLDVLAGDSSAALSARHALSDDTRRYEEEAAPLKTTAEALDREAEHCETRALRYDVGEGLLELGLVMASLYFLAHRRAFVLIGGIAAVSGLIAGVLGMLA